MDIRTQLAHALHSIMRNDAQGSGQKSPNTAVGAEAAKLADQFASARPDLLRQMGAYGQKGEVLTAALGLKTGQKPEEALALLKDLTQFIGSESTSRLSLLMQRNLQDAYLHSLLILSFGWLDKKIQKKSKQPPQRQHEQQKEEEAKQQESTENMLKSLVEALLTHAEFQTNPEEFQLWARKSLDITQQQLQTKAVVLSPQSEQMLALAYKVLDALDQGLSVQEIRQMIQ